MFFSPSPPLHHVSPKASDEMIGIIDSWHMLSEVWVLDPAIYFPL